MSKLQVVIRNPKSPNGYTSLKSAQRYVERGRARWVQENAIVEFIDDKADYRAEAVEKSQERTLRAMQIGYDFDVNFGQRASLDAIKNLPVAGDPAKCFTLARNAHQVAPPLRRCKPLRVLVKDGEPVSA